MKPISAGGSRRIVEFAFDYARRNGRSKVTAVHKANIMKFTDGLYLHVAREVAAENEDVEFEDKIVDNLDAARPAAGGVRRARLPEPLRGHRLRPLRRPDRRPARPGGNFGTHAAVFEPTHGSAPKYTGQNRVNPMAMMLSGVMMLRHLEERDAADRLEGAIAAVIAEGRSVTYDMKPQRDDPTAVGTSEVADAIIDTMGVRFETEGDGGRSGQRRRDRRAGDRAARLRDVVLVDIKEGLPQGKALDLNEAGPVLGYEPTITGSNGYEETAGSTSSSITAGLPRKPGMSRDDLVTTNEQIVGSVTREAVEHSPDAILMVVSNPLDAMCHVAKNVSGWPRSVFGMAGILDTARFSTFIAWETGASAKDVTAMVLGGHGDQMVPVVSATSVGGVPLTKLASAEAIEAMVERTRKGGGEVVELLGTRRYAPGAAVAQMVDAVMLDQKRVLPLHGAPPGRVRDRRPLHGRAGKLGAAGSRRSSSST